MYKIDARAYGFWKDILALSAEVIEILVFQILVGNGEDLLLVQRRQLYFCRFAYTGSIPDLTAYKASQTIVCFPLVSMV